MREVTNRDPTRARARDRPRGRIGTGPEIGSPRQVVLSGLRGILFRSPPTGRIPRPPAMTQLRSRLVSVGTHFPETVVTNDDLEKLMDTSDEWIRQRTGIEERRWVPEDDPTSASDLGAEAAKVALERAGLQPSDVDLIIFGSLSPDVVFPGTGCYVQAKLGIEEVPALDIRQQCSAFPYGLSIADAYIRTGMYRRILMVGSEVQSKALDIRTRGRDMTVLFGDGAGAVVIEAFEAPDDLRECESVVFGCDLGADGSFADDLVFRSPGTSNRRWNPRELIDEIETYPWMKGKIVFVNAVKRMPQTIQKTLDAHGFTFDDVDLFLLHQANARISDKCAEVMGVPREKVFDTIQKYGNTTAATIPIGIDEAIQAGKLEKGMLVATGAFGAGFTWGAALFRW